MRIAWCIIVVSIWTLSSLCPPCSYSAQAVTDSTTDEVVKSENEQPPQSETSLATEVQKIRPNIEWTLSFAKIFWAVVILLVGLLVIKNITALLDTIAERWTHMRLMIKRLVPIIRIFGWTFVIYIVIVGIFSPPIETLFAVTASAGIALGFASQDILKNIFGGIMILFDRPFQVGDKIQVGDHYGEVVSIGLRTVRIVTPDDSLVSIPNSEIVNQSVSNANSGASTCQVVAEFYLPAYINIAEVKNIAHRAAAVSRYVYLNKPIAVIVKNEIHQGRSLLKLRLKAYVLDLRFEFLFMSEMTEIVLQTILAKKLVSSEDLAFIQPSR